MTGNVLSTTFLPAPALPPGRPRLVLTGFMGTGKSTAGKEAAAALGLPFVDLDRLIEARAGRAIPEIFAGEGEPGFRERERRAMLDLARLSGLVVATGGGAVMQVDAFDTLAAGAEVVVLTADPEVLARRVRAGDGRPMLGGDDLDVPGRIRALLAERSGRYAQVGTAVDTSRAIRGAAGPEAAERYRRRVGDGGGPGLTRVDVPGPGGSYPVLIGRGALEGLPGALCAALPDVTSVAVVSAEAVAGAVGEGVASALRHSGLRAAEVTVPGDEAAKDLDTVRSLWARLHQAGLSRTDAVIAIGGGATLDAVGFAAATYARGIPLVNVPTTLLAMVDAGLGGKVGIDHEGVKNLIGAFHHPSLVVADPTTLGTLPAPLVRHGLAEAVKGAALAAPAMLDVLDGGARDADGLPRHLDWIVEQAVRIKAAYVGADAYDRSIRRSLNLGHTFAHAIESASGYAVPHGDAVAIGTVAAARLGERLGVTPHETAERLRRSFEGLGLPVALPPGVDRDAMLTAFGSDKKRLGGRIVFVVPAPGGAALVEMADPGAALDAMVVEGEAR